MEIYLNKYIGVSTWDHTGASIVIQCFIMNQEGALAFTRWTVTSAANINFWILANSVISSVDTSINILLDVEQPGCT